VLRPGRRNGGTTLVFRLTRPAVLRITVFRVYPSCKRVGSFSVRAHEGVNRIRFRGRLGGRTLRPGGYRLVVRARGAERDAAAVPIVIARGRTTAAELRRARTASACSTQIADLGANEADPATGSPGGDDQGTLGAALSTIKTPIAGAGGLLSAGAKSVSRTARDAARGLKSAVADPFKDPVVLTIVGLMAFFISLLGLLILAYFVRVITDEGARSGNPS
jgi:hypothetical protein